MEDCKQIEIEEKKENKKNNKKKRRKDFYFVFSISYICQSVCLSKKNRKHK